MQNGKSHLLHLHAVELYDQTFLQGEALAFRGKKKNQDMCTKSEQAKSKTSWLISIPSPCLLLHVPVAVLHCPSPVRQLKRGQSQSWLHCTEPGSVTVVHMGLPTDRAGRAAAAGRSMGILPAVLGAALAGCPAITLGPGLLRGLS